MRASSRTWGRQFARLAAATAALAVIAAAPAPTSPASPAEQQGPLRITAITIEDHPTVGVTVTAPRQLLPPTVGADTFEVSEAGEHAEVTRVTPVSASDLDVVLAVDTSGSMAGGAMPGAKRAAIGFFDALPADLDVSVLGFGEQPQTAAPFGSSRDQVHAAINALEPGGETALYDAVATAAGLFPDSDAGTQRAIVLLSDGGDTVSKAALEQAEQTLQRSGVTLYAVELVSAESDHASLVRLAGAADGQVVPASDPAALEGVYRDLAEQLTSQYEVVFTSTGTGATNVKVSLAGDPSAAAETTVELPAPPPPAPAETTPPAPAQPVGTLVQPGWWASSPVLAASLAAVAMGLLLLGLVFVLPKEPRTRLAGEHSDSQTPLGGWAPGQRGTTFLSSTAERTSRAADRLLSRLGLTDQINRALERAGIDLRPGEYLVLVASAALASGAVGLVLMGTVGALLFVVGALIGGWSIPSVLTSRRRAKFEEQLADVLQLLAGSLRVGHGLLQAVDTVAREAESPAKDEFQRIVLETRLGRDLGDSLQAMADRLQNQDFTWIVQAIEINREVGGDLAEVLDTVAATIRERQQLRRHVKALSAEGRLSAGILFALPLAVGAWMWLTATDYISLLFTESLGIAMLVGAGTALIAGAIWMRKIIKLDY